MGRVSRGIQLGRTSSRAARTAISVAAAAAGVTAAVGAFEIWRRGEAFTAVEEGGTPARPGAPAAIAGHDPERSRETEVLLVSGAQAAPRLGRVLDGLIAAGPDDLRITSIELRPGAGGRIVEASVAAEAPTPAGVAGFLATLAGLDSVRSTAEIQEMRSSAGIVTVRVTLRVEDAERAAEIPG